MAKRRKKSGSCKRAHVVIWKKRGGRKYQIADFMARKGSSCGPRKKPSTRHLTKYKKAFAAAAKACKRAGKKGTSFGKCIGAKLK